MKTLKGSELVLNVLQQQGVNQVFGYPGGAIMPLYDALYSSPIKHYLFRHEQGAGFAAVGYARATGKVGVCIATSGPGATNLMTSLADAMLDSVPVVAITGQVASTVQGTDAFQEADIIGMSLAVTKHSFLVSDSDDLQAILNEAFAIALEGRPGPVLVDIPKDILLADIIVEPDCGSVLAPASETQPEEINPALLAKAQTLLNEAKQPVLYVGGGVGMAKANTALRDFQHRCDIPSVTTLKGIGSLDNTHSTFLGMLGMHGNASANIAVQECDLLIAAGARFDDRVTGQLESFAPDAKVIHLDIDPAETNKLRTADVAIHTPLPQVFPQLAQALTIAPWRKHCMDLKRTHAWQYDFDKPGIYAPALLHLLSQSLPANTVVSCDVGQHQMWVAQHMQFDSPNNHLSSGGLGTMGFGLPAAIGAQLARPDDTVVLISGDGSFMMNVQELQTIKRYKLPVKVVVIDNQRLGMVRQWQQLFFEKRYSETTLDDNPDFVKLAAVFDIPGKTIHQAEEVEQALANLINSNGPYVLQVCINADDNVWPLVPPGKSNRDMLQEIL